MKKALLMLSLFFGAIMIANKTFAQADDDNFHGTISVSICDGFGYTWSFPSLSVDGAVYSGNGQCDIGDTKRWKATISGNKKKSAGKFVTFTAVNKNPDGCTLHTDNFEYDGTASIHVAHDGTFTFSGSGTWTSYCAGSVISSGSWSASQCGTKVIIHNTGPLPATPSQKSTLKVSPNPVVNTATISYKVAAPSKVNITVYNAMMQPVKVLVNETKNAGSYTAMWDAKSAQVNAGTYRVVSTINGVVTSTTVQVIK